MSSQQVGQGVRIAVVYAACAAVAIVVNLVSQAAALSAGAPLWGAIGVGTVCGLVAKYELDRRIVFARAACKSGRIAGTFLLYAGTGVLTTLIFWSVELLGQLVLGGGVGRNIGAAIGLVLGYVVKYRLDARYVFARTGP